MDNHTSLFRLLLSSNYSSVCKCQKSLHTFFSAVSHNFVLHVNFLYLILLVQTTIFFFAVAFIHVTHLLIKTFKIQHLQVNINDDL